MSHGVFGDGNLESQLSIKKRLGDACLVQESNPKKEFNKGMVKDLKIVANAIVRIADRTKNMLVECKDDEVSIALTESARALLGSRSDSLHEAPFDVCTQVGNVLSQSEDPFWTSPELMKVVEEIEAALSRRNDIIKCENDECGFNDDLPFFQADTGHTEEVHLFSPTVVVDVHRPQGNTGTSEVDPPVQLHESDIPAVVDDQSKIPEATTEEEATNKGQPNPSDVVMEVVNDIVVEHPQVKVVAPAQPKVDATSFKKDVAKKTTCGRPGKRSTIQQTNLVSLRRSNRVRSK